MVLNFCVFHSGTRDTIRNDMRIWNAYHPQYRLLCYDTQAHPLGNYPSQDDCNRIYKVPIAPSSALAQNRYFYVNIEDIIKLQESDINVNADMPWYNRYSPTTYDVKSVMLQVGTFYRIESFWISVCRYALSIRHRRNWLAGDNINGVNALD